MVMDLFVVLYERQQHLQFICLGGPGLCIPSFSGLFQGFSVISSVRMGLICIYLIQVTNEMGEICGHFRFKKELLSAERVCEGNRSCVKRQALMGFVAFPIFFVAHYRMSDVREMHTDLVLPARQQINFQQSEVFCLFEYLVSSMRQLSFCGIGCGVHAVGCVLCQICRNGL